MKTLKIAFFTAVLSAAPSLVAASCSSSHQAMSCAEGMTWDAQSSSCVKQINT
ncbi:MAG: hypothetical protein ACRBBT_14250 [Paracoccaceae bacterium]